MKYDWQIEKTEALLKNPEHVRKSELFRSDILELYGFTMEARAFISNHSRVIILDFESVNGGGAWWGDIPPFYDLVQLFTAQHEAAVHEFSHVWWHWFRVNYPEIKEEFCCNVAKIINSNQLPFPEFKKIFQLTNDWEVFAEVSSLIMGMYKYGPHQLPEFMWKYFEPLFTGRPKVLPYYLGGHP